MYCQENVLGTELHDGQWYNTVGGFVCLLFLLCHFFSRRPLWKKEPTKYTRKFALSDIISSSLPIAMYLLCALSKSPFISLQM
jgi:hypothetical protein